MLYSWTVPIRGTSKKTMFSMNAKFLTLLISSLTTKPTEFYFSVST